MILNGIIKTENGIIEKIKISLYMAFDSRLAFLVVSFTK